MKSRRTTSKRSTRGYIRPSPSVKKMMAQWIVDRPDITPKEVAAGLGISLSLAYRIIGEYLEAHTIYVFKRPTEPTE